MNNRTNQYNSTPFDLMPNHNGATRPFQPAILSEMELLFDLSSKIICVTSYDGQIKKVNQLFINSFYWLENEIVGQSLFDLIHPASKALAVNQFIKLFQGQQAVRFKGQGKNKLGHYDAYAWSAYPTNERSVLVVLERENAGINHTDSLNINRPHYKELLSILNELSRGIHKSADLPKLLQSALQLTTNVLDATSGYIGDWDSTTQKSKLIAEYFSPNAGDLERVYEIGNEYDPSNNFANPLDWLNTSESGFLSHTDELEPGSYEREFLTRYGVKSAMEVTLVAHGAPVGYIEIWESRQKRNFSEDELDLLQTVARQLAHTIHSTKLYESLRESVRIQNAIVNNANYAIVSTTTDGVIQTFNPAAEKMFGDTVNQVIGIKKLTHFFDTAQGKAATFDSIIAGINQQTAIEQEKRFKTANGTSFLGLQSVSTLLDEQNSAIIGYLFVISNITQRKKAEEALFIQTRAIESSNDPITIADATLPDMPLTYVNQAFTTVTGYTAEEVIGKNCRFLQGPETDQTELKTLRNALQNGLACTVTLLNYRKDGTTFWNELQISPIYDDNNNLTHFIGIQNDITERRNASEKLEKQASQLQAVADVSTTITKIQDSKELLNVVVNLVKERFDLYHVHIYLLNKVTQTMVLTVGAGTIGQEMVAEGLQIPLSSEKSIVARCVRKGEGIIVNDVQQDSHFLPNSYLPHTKSEMAIPIVIGNDTLGVLDIQSEHLQNFDQGDLQIQKTLAAQIAVALQNAQSFEQNQKVLDELDILTRRLTREGWESELKKHNGLKIDYNYNLDDNHLQVGGKSNTSYLTHPLTILGESIGELSIDTPMDMASEAEAIVDAVAKQLSSHVENLRLTEQTGQALRQTAQQAQRLAKLTQLSEVLVRTESKEQILSLATEHTKEILSADRVSVATINPKAPDYLDLYANNTENKSHFETTIQLKGSGLDTTIFSKKAHYTSEISPDHEMVDQIKAQAIAPLITGQNVLGTLNLGFLSPREMTGQEKDIFLQISSLIASALQNNQLFEQTQSRANQLATVADVSTAASTILDPDILLKTVVDLTKARFNLYHAHIYLLEGENLVLKAGAGEIGDIMVEQNWQIAASNPVSLVAKAARNLEGVIANNVQSDPLFLPNKHLPATRAELAIPMIAGEKLIGVLDVQSNFADAFSEQDVLIQSTLATQVAIALQNAELYLEQLKTAEQLREVDRLKTEFLARMSHELRTPLNSIIGFSDVLLEGLDGPLTPRMEEDVVVIRDSGRHLKELIGDILDLSKIEAGMMTLNLQPVELSMLCDEVMATSQGLAFEKKIELNLELPEIIEPVTIDRTRIKQVLINLVGNAIKFTDAGGVTISIKNETDNVRFEVIDTGIGIAPENLGLVFEEFRQVDGSLTRQSGGTGLGIPISKRLVELHGGVMGLDSEFGVGSTFWFTLPRTPQD